MAYGYPDSRRMSRREWLEVAARCAALLPGAALISEGALLASRVRPQDPTVKSATAPFSLEDEVFLEEIEQASFRYFWEQASPYTGLVKDRSQVNGSDPRVVASIAATGFGLTALCIAERRGWLKSGQARDRVRAALRYLWEWMPQQRGFFFHFVNMHNGERAFDSEVSSIDTALLLCGVLSCRAYFDDPEIYKLATQINQRVDWNWMRNGGETLSHGWKPESGFLRARWSSYCELMMMYLLGLGSLEHPLPPETWEAWGRPMYEYKSIRYVGAHAPLFVHQYSHAWFDFRRCRDRHANYYRNSVLATQVHKTWCLSLADSYPYFSEDLWGITASDSARGYVVWGGPPPMGPIDGTVVPCAAGGSLPFLPQETLRVLYTIRQRYGDRAWRRYGFVDAFNPKTGWYARDVIGIDAGITLLMAENARTSFVWDTFMRNEEVRRGMERAGFHPESG